jgi:hypothetical protein
VFLSIRNTETSLLASATTRKFPNGLISGGQVNPRPLIFQSDKLSKESRSAVEEDRHLNLWEKYPTLQEAIKALPPELQRLLVRHEGARFSSEWLKQKYPKEAFRDSASEAVFNWDMTGMWFASQNRLYEALSIHSELYSLMCAAESGHGSIHKGLALVRLRDWHRRLEHPWHEERYLLLTLIQDAIRSKGSIIPENTGIYHRFRWEHGRSDAEFNEIAESAWKTFSDNSDLHEFPEEILCRLESSLSKRTAAYAEADLYEINVEYASMLYKRAAQKDWRALERLTSYELSTMPVSS